MAGYRCGYESDYGRGGWMISNKTYLKHSQESAGRTMLESSISQIQRHISSDGKAI